MKLAAAVLSMVGVASAFVAPMPKASRGRSLQMSFDDAPGAVKWFPPSPGYWVSTLSRASFVIWVLDVKALHIPINPFPLSLSTKWIDL